MPKAQTTQAASSFYIPTGFPPFDDLVGGAPRGTITAVVGPPEAFKTTICAQVAAGVAFSQQKNVLVFDTELSYHSYLGLAEKLTKRLGVEVNPVRVIPNVRATGPKDDPTWKVDWDIQGEVKKGAVNVFVVYCPDIRPILVMHGRGADVVVSGTGSGKVKTVLLAGAFATTIEEAPFYKFVKDHDIAVLVYDSITNPLDEFPAVSENFPSRTDFTQLWLIQVQKLAAALDIPVFATVHESTNPASPFNPALKYEGGKGVGYNLKFIVYMMKEKNKALIPKGASIRNSVPTLPLDGRHLFLMRHPKQAPWGRFVSIKMSEEGLVALNQAGSTASEPEEAEDADSGVEA